MPSCVHPTTLLLAAGFASGMALGFLFRASDAETKQARRGGNRSWLIRSLNAPLFSLRGILMTAAMLALAFFLLKLPGTLAGVVPMCSTEEFRVHKLGLIAGTFLGWFLRYLLWLRVRRNR